MAPEARRLLLLASAMKVFSEYGLVAANHALVAAQAKVSVPTVFFYFPTREALVDAVLTEVERHFIHVLATAGKTEASAAGHLTTIIHTLTATIDTHPEHTRIYREWSIASQPDNWSRFLRLNRRFTRLFARLIERGQAEGVFRADMDPEDEAVITHATSTALFQMKQTGVSPRRLERFLRAIVHSLQVQHADAPRATKPPANPAEPPVAQRNSTAAPTTVSPATNSAGKRIRRSRDRSTVAEAAKPTSRHKPIP
jgi:TetR/AcrR family hemagglutinin/protease transcriptional regulator